ncbi:TPA: hypothetical protein L9L56_004465 [Klebsiella pneumoniae]|uniref:hypothetical protein n=1 Tax=Klebsiella pneumoniae TaxID=573 RepID=UPI000E2FAA4F|nr:hypothetical protein [Klebsiella pneumoniae]HBR1366641.1 hypothetical protein [Klebsiella pneumoniae]HBR2015032.1 hypothetical protein [Klebsiella pneumoniae]
MIATVTRVFDVWKVEAEPKKPEEFLIDVEVFCDGLYRNHLLHRTGWREAIGIAPGDEVSIR